MESILFVNHEAGFGNMFAVNGFAAARGLPASGAMGAH